MNTEEKLALIKIKYPSFDVIEKLKFRNPESDILKDIKDGTLDDLFDNLLAKYPSCFVLRVGYSCNNKCIHCFADNKKTTEDLPIDVLKTLIDTVGKKGSIVIVTGGEPTVREDLQEILDYINTKGYINNIQTNGVRFGDIEYVRKMEKYIDTVFIPIHSYDEKIHDAVTQVPGSWNSTITGLRNLKNSHIDVTTNMVINQLNYKTISQTLDLIQSIHPGIKMTLTFPHPVSVAHSTDIVPRFSDVKEYLQLAFKKYGYLLSTHYIPYCYLYPYQDIINVVDESDRGTVYKAGIDFINGVWSNIDYGEFKEGTRIKSETCKLCLFDSKCIGVWKEYGEIYPQLDLIPIV